MPVEIPDAIPFDDDTTHTVYDGDQARRFWQLLVQIDRVFEEFRSRFVGKVSPVHLFWGAFDLAVTRFSGRGAPPHPGGAPNCGPHVMREAYSHEVSSAGYWPGPDGEGVFYSYAYPVPDGFADADIGVAGAYYDDAARRVRAPVHGRPDGGRSRRGSCSTFLQATYAAAADLAGWDRAGTRTTVTLTGGSGVNGVACRVQGERPPHEVVEHRVRRRAQDLVDLAHVGVAAEGVDLAGSRRRRSRRRCAPAPCAARSRSPGGARRHARRRCRRS